MGHIGNIVLGGLLLFSSCKNQAQNANNPSDYIYGKWKYEKHLWSGLGKYTIVQVDSIKKSTLRIEKDKIYFDNIKFIDTCKFSSSTIKFSKLLDKGNYEYDWFEDGTKLLLRTKDTGPLPTLYTKEQLSKINLIDFGCGYDLSILYLKQDTLILNYLAGVTIFLTKMSNDVQDYSGTGSTTKELPLTGKVTAVKLSYEFYKEPDQLIIEDQNGKQLFKTEMIATNGVQLTTVPLNGVRKLIFNVNSEQPNSKWRFKVELK